MIDRKKLREISENATPAPWKACSEGLWVYATAPEEFLVADTYNRDEDAVATIRGWGHLQYKGEKTAIQIQKANGQVIAAARNALPELLDLLDECEKSFSEVMIKVDWNADEFQTPKGYEQTRTIILNILSKLRGEK